MRLSPQHQTKPHCQEDFVERDGLPLRAVVCMRAYKKLPQLYDVAVLVATLDQTQGGVQGRFDAQGVSFANAQRLGRTTSTPTDGCSRTRRAPPALLEMVDRDGQVRQAWRIEHWPVSIGRALDNDVVLSDPHVAAHHATPRVADAPTARRRARRHAGETATASASAAAHRRRRQHRDRRTGRRASTCRRPRPAAPARWPTQALGAEQPLRRSPCGRCACCRPRDRARGARRRLAQHLPRHRPRQLRPRRRRALLDGHRRRRVWCGAWALLSKTFTRQSHFGWHLRVFVVAASRCSCWRCCRALLAFAFSWPWLTDFSFIATSRSAPAALYFHLLAVEPARPAAAARVVATGAVVGIALTLWFNVQRTSRSATSST